MKIVVAKDYEDLSRRAALIIAGHITVNPCMVLGLATGSTPIGTYKRLVRFHKEDGLDFTGITTFNLDEYIGLEKEHPQSYRSFMYDNLFAHINIDSQNVNFPDTTAKDLRKECRIYEEKIVRSGGIDLQLLGIGRNGHIGFNEPADQFYPRTDIFDLTEDTVNANARFFGPGEKVPSRAISMGIGTIMKARRIILLANGPQKTAAIRSAVKGPVHPSAPASILQLHPDVTIIISEISSDVISQIGIDGSGS